MFVTHRNLTSDILKKFFAVHGGLEMMGAIIRTGLGEVEMETARALC